MNYVQAEDGDIKDISKASHSDIIEEVKLKLSESLTSPGEPIISLELADDQTTPEAEITDPRCLFYFIPCRTMGVVL